MTDLEPGQIVVFGRPNGIKRSGRIVKVNPKSVRIQDDDDGDVWTVAHSLVTVCDDKAKQEQPAPVPAARANLGRKVWFSQLAVGDHFHFLNGKGDPIAGLSVKIGKRFYKCVGHVNARGEITFTTSGLEDIEMELQKAPSRTGVQTAILY